MFHSKKGQFSFDVILAIAIFLLIANLLIWFSGDFDEAQQKLAVKIQAEQIATDTGTILGYKEYLSSITDTFSYDYNISYIRLKNAVGYTDCEIKTNASGLTLTFDETHSRLIESGNPIISTFKSTQLDNENYLCGQTIKKEKT